MIMKNTMLQNSQFKKTNQQLQKIAVIPRTSVRSRVLLHAATFFCLSFSLGQAQAQAQTTLIGQTAVQSGPLASLSVGASQGIKALITSVNSSGGVGGRQLELVVLDDGYDAAKAAENVKALAEKGAVAILMPIGTPPSLGAIKAGNELNIPVVGAYTGAAPARKFSPNAFMIRTGYDEEYDNIIQHLITIGITDIAFAHNDNPGARGAMASTIASLEKRGFKLKGSVAINNDASDAASQAQVLAKLNAKAIVMSVNTKVAVPFIKAYKSTGSSALFYSFSFLNGQELHKSLGDLAKGIVISQVVPYPWQTNVPVVRDYQEAMKKAGFTQFSYESFEGYLNARVLVEGLKRAGSRPSRESLRTALESMRATDIGGFKVDFSPQKHNGSSYFDLTMVGEDGRYVR